MAATGWRWTYTSAFRWIDVSFSLPTSFMRWPRLFASYFTPNWAPGPVGRDISPSSSPSPWSSLSFAFASQRWLPRNWWWREFEFSLFDSVLWPVVTAFESVALVSMLCFFFLFCGCTI